MTALCVGAVSRRVVEEAARLQVPQIVASRRQCDLDGGYLEWDQRDLVAVVRRLSNGKTEVVRDHGGPFQGHEDGGMTFEFDVAAGFDGLHVDVCKLPHDIQAASLFRILTDLKGLTNLFFEVGGEHTRQLSNRHLIETALRAGVVPRYAVMNVGTYVHAERQCGNIMRGGELHQETLWYHEHGVRVKMHNCDWVGRADRILEYADAYNIAPEFAAVEIDALLQCLPRDVNDELLRISYDAGHWRHWFDENEGTTADRARCGLRYVLEEPDVKQLTSLADETFVRGRIREAISRG